MQIAEENSKERGKVYLEIEKEGGEGVLQIGYFLWRKEEKNGLECQNIGRGCVV